VVTAPMASKLAAKISFNFINISYKNGSAILKRFTLG
jgi:hypothetical protein